MPHLAKGLCSGHWHQQRRGVPLKPLRKRRPTVRDTLEHYRTIEGEHWIWTGNTNKKGYGVIKRRGQNSTETVQRAAYKEYVGPIPDGTEIDHTCRVRNCFRPSHLEAVTHLVNVQRAWAERKRLRVHHDQ